MENKFIYTISVRNKKIVSVLSDVGTNHFVSPVTKKGGKIYIVGKRRQIHYVGITRQPIRNRLYSGVKPNHAAGYHGYKWLVENGDHCLIIWEFDDKANIEALEAEVVHCLRINYGDWPEYQTEIHFHPTKDNERTLAKRIFQESDRIVRNFV